MNERPIIFSGAMVRAILDGTKTQTRRIVKDDAWHNFGDCDTDGRMVDAWAVDPTLCPYGKAGDRLWVRETHAPGADHWGAWARRMDCDGSGPDPQIFYAADGGERPFIERWRPSIHMPRFASRITLEITEVRAQRLHDITEADVVAEGVSTPGPFAVHHFMDLWTSINGRESWPANPWVWVLSFKRVQP